MKSLLIGHRGEPEYYPENSLAGFRAVLDASARYIETDVQITADGIPILSHDPTLLKITGHELVITETDYQTLRELPAGYDSRFGERFRDLRIARLDEFAALLHQYPQARAFVEVKHASIKAHGAARVIDLTLEALDDSLSQCIIISFEHEALVHVREITSLPIGWVLPEWSVDSRVLATELGPEYLFCNRKRLPSDTEPLWPGPWQWVVYTVNTADEVQAFRSRGVDLLETNVITRLLADGTLGNVDHG
ncbi:MAG: glycerophosphodiester phosphodiesterase family protein [Gammaproteobacteria bacterium]|nr:glycerophosphodiester phosphodiesterase family protein [Gammaproteobacteria bacterium]